MFARISPKARLPALSNSPPTYAHSKLFCKSGTALKCVTRRAHKIKLHLFKFLENDAADFTDWNVVKFDAL